MYSSLSIILAKFQRVGKNFIPATRLMISTRQFYIEPNPSKNKKKTPEQMKIKKNRF